MQRIRLTYAKTEALRYTSNLDMQKVWERTIRRAGLALAYSQGFHPQPRIQQACPLPLGYLSDQEIIDFWLDSDCSLEAVSTAIQHSAPPGIEFKNLESIDVFAPALQKLVQSSLYMVEFLDPLPLDELRFKTNQLLASTTILRERREKKYDLRPLVETLSICACPEGHNPRALMKLMAREGATGRPDEVLLAMEIDPFSTRIKRVALFFDSDPQK